MLEHYCTRKSFNAMLQKHATLFLLRMGEDVALGVDLEKEGTQRGKGHDGMGQAAGKDAMRWGGETVDTLKGRASLEKCAEATSMGVPTKPNDKRVEQEKNTAHKRATFEELLKGVATSKGPEERTTYRRNFNGPAKKYPHTSGI